mmetsp:Transcript_161/g.200  ORF Transcript_161/g.200 Transcript_161/m.200 type:complete len:113 (-) Transcript_161:611-949(-)
MYADCVSRPRNVSSILKGSNVEPSELAHSSKQPKLKQAIPVFFLLFLLGTTHGIFPFSHLLSARIKSNVCLGKLHQLHLHFFSRYFQLGPTLTRLQITTIRWSNHRLHSIPI